MSNPQSELNLAFLGCGFATRLHSKTLKSFKNAVRCFYASRDAGKAAEFNRQFKGAGSFDSYDAAISAHDIDVILIATPPNQHLDLTLQSLQADKHVIVEKPPFLNTAHFDAVRKAQQNAHRRVFVAENYFYKPLAKKLRALIAENLIGEILFIHVNALKKQDTGNWRDDAALTGGGALFEGGVHWVNFMANLGFTIKSVQGFCPGSKTQLERSILVNFKYEEGPVGSLYYSWETPSLFKGLRISKIYGTTGSLTFESNGLIIVVRGSKKAILFPGLKDIAGYRAMFQDFFSAIKSDRSPEFSLALAEQDMKLIEEVYESLKSK
ncbi:MAG: Gfo/Idh/MocA family protein [bacterium]